MLAASVAASRPAARTVICWPKIARTAISKPSHAPGTRRPGRAATSGASIGSRSSSLAIVRGVARQVEHVPHARDHRGQCGQLLEPHLHPQRTALGTVRNRKGSQHAAEFDHPGITVGRHELHARNGARLQKPEQPLEVVRGAVGQEQLER